MRIHATPAANASGDAGAMQVGTTLTLGVRCGWFAKAQRSTGLQPAGQCSTGWIAAGHHRLAPHSYSQSSGFSTLFLAGRATSARRLMSPRRLISCTDPNDHRCNLSPTPNAALNDAQRPFQADRPRNQGVLSYIALKISREANFCCGAGGGCGDRAPVFARGTLSSTGATGGCWARRRRPLRRWC